MRLLSRASASGMGLLVGLLLTEALFWVRDLGAFPHLNLYEPDPALGARLMPSSRQRISFGGNPVSTVRVNARGYRGADWPEPAADAPRGEILVVGDSQVFGLGVEDDQTHPARLAVHTGQAVLNGGVPTYGPSEYLAVARELVEQRPTIDTLVVVFNFSNDLFEVGRPNRERHAIWDGWAVRIETAPSSTWWFPGRDLLYRRSHAFFALRKLLWRAQGLDNRSLPSEGAPWDVVVAESGRAASQHAQQQGMVQAQQQDAASRYEAAVAMLGDQQHLLRLMYYVEPMDGAKVQAFIDKRQPGDIVGNPYAEGARPIQITAEILAEGATIRKEMRQRLAAWAEAHPDTPMADEIQAALVAPSSIAPSLASERIAGLPALGSALDPALDEAVALARAYDLKLVVVALPLDVQVSPTQWEKYNLPPMDLSETELLLDDLGISCARRGIRFLNALQPLRELGDQAFLQGDLHLNAAGQDRLAAAIAETLQAPAPIPPPLPGLPAGRSRVPSESEWRAAREAIVRGSTRNRCSTWAIREWLKLTCQGDPWEGLRAMQRLSGPLEVFGWVEEGKGHLWVPLLPGRDASVQFWWDKRSEVLTVTWEGERHRAAFAEAGWGSPPFDPAVDEQRQFVGDGASWCEDTYGKPLNRFTHPEFWSCLQGTRRNLPDCPDGQVNAGSAGHCFPLCSEEKPCADGVCTPWQESAVCL